MRQKLKTYRGSPGSFLLLVLVILSAAVTAGIVLFLLAYILINGIPNLSPELFEWEYNSENVSMMPALINTFIMVILTLLLAVPVGVFSAIYMTEYAGKGNKLVAIIKLTAETLSGIPSIVYGLFVFLLFVIALKWQYCLLAGVLTLAIMVLPLIMRTTQEALLSVPDSFREGSYGLGAGKLRTIFRIVLPAAMLGILSGIILAVGRIVGESAALIFTSGTVAAVPDMDGGIFSWLFCSARTLSVHMYALLSEGLYTRQAYAAAVVLLGVVLSMNLLSGWLAKKLNGNKQE